MSENVKLQNKVRQLEKLLADAGVVGPGQQSENSHDTPPVQNVPVHDSTSGKVWDVQQPGPENFAISSHLLGRNQRHVFEENWEAILNDVRRPYEKPQIYLCMSSILTWLTGDRTYLPAGAI